MVRWKRTLETNVLGRTVALGYAQVDIVDYRIVSGQPAPDEPGHVVVRIGPSSEQAANVFERLVKQRTNGKRERSGKKRGGKKRR